MRNSTRIPADIAATCRNLAVQFTTATQVPISPGKVLALAARRGLTTLTPEDFLPTKETDDHG